MLCTSVRARPGRALALMVGAAVLWGTVGVVVRELHDDAGLSAERVAWLRSLVAAAALGLGGLIARRGLRRATAARRLTTSDVKTVALVGAGVATFQVLYFAAVNTIGVAVATLIGLGLAPLLVAGGEARWLGVRHSTRVGAAVAVSSIGLVLLVAPGSTTDIEVSRWVLGCALAALSAAGYAAVTLLMRARAEHLDRATLTGGAFAVGAVVLLPFALRTADGHYDAEAIALIAFLGVVGSALAYLMFFAALRDLGGTASAVAVLLEPLTAAVLAWLLLGETLGAAGIAGGVLLLGAVAAVATEGD